MSNLLEKIQSACRALKKPAGEALILSPCNYVNNSLQRDPGLILAHCKIVKTAALVSTFLAWSHHMFSPESLKHTGPCMTFQT